MNEQAKQVPAMSPWGPEDEIGRLNLITEDSRAAAMSGLDPSRTFDLGLDLYIGMPSWAAAGDPSFAIWMTHTPSGNIVDDAMHRPHEERERVGYSGDSIAMYTHCGTHIDTLNHFSWYGKIWNGFNEAEHLGSRHWTKCGADKLPPIVARGVMLDIPAALGMDMLPQGHAISPDEIKKAEERQGTPLREGDIALVRTGRMATYPDWEGFMVNSPGISLDAAKYIVEEGGAILIGADNVSVEQAPSPVKDNWVPVHCYCFQEVGVCLMEFTNLEPLAAAGIHEFCFIGSALKIRGATGAPVRPIAIAYAKN